MPNIPSIIFPSSSSFLFVSVSVDNLTPTRTIFFSLLSISLFTAVIAWTILISSLDTFSSVLRMLLQSIRFIPFCFVLSSSSSFLIFSSFVYLSFSNSSTLAISNSRLSIFAQRALKLSPLIIY